MYDIFEQTVQPSQDGPEGHVTFVSSKPFDMSSKRKCQIFSSKQVERFTSGRFILKTHPSTTLAGHLGVYDTSIIHCIVLDSSLMKANAKLC